MQDNKVSELSERLKSSANELLRLVNHNDDDDNNSSSASSDCTTQNDKGNDFEEEDEDIMAMQRAWSCLKEASETDQLSDIDAKPVDVSIPSPMPDDTKVIMARYLEQQLKSVN